MRIPPLLSTSIVVIIMGSGALMHLLHPQIFVGLVFAPLPAYPVIYASGMVEGVIAFCAIWHRTRAHAGLAFAALCTLYMPLHIWDLVRDDPVIRPHTLAILRVFLQLAFIALGLNLWKTAQR